MKNRKIIDFNQFRTLRERNKKKHVSMRGRDRFSDKSLDHTVYYVVLISEISTKMPYGK